MVEIGSKRVPLAIVIPACEEESCLGRVLDEMAPLVARLGGVVAVGINGSCDRTSEVARSGGAIVGEVNERGYGYGCLAAIHALKEARVEPDAYLFVAGDGANSASDVELIWRHFEAGSRAYDLLIGERTWAMESNRPRSWRRRVANLILGLYASLLSGHLYFDLGPLRILRRDCFESLVMVEREWGWTIEPQILVPFYGGRVETLSIGERPRLAGEQKVSGTGFVRSLWIGGKIFGAGLRVRWRAAKMLASGSAGSIRES